MFLSSSDKQSVLIFLLLFFFSSGQHVRYVSSTFLAKFSILNAKNTLLLTLQPHYGVKTITATYLTNLISVLIVYDKLYLNAAQQAFDQQTQRGHVIRLQCIDIGSMNSTQYEEAVRNAVNIVTEGFITVLTNTTAFLHARYSATPDSCLRLKDKYYLREHGDPFIHIMFLVVPSNINSKEVNYENKQNKTDRIYKPQNLVKQTSWSSGKVTSKTTTTTIATTTIATILSTTKQTAAINSNFVFTDCKSCSVRWYRDINFVLWTQKFAGTAGNLNAKHLEYLCCKSFAKNTQLYPDKLSNLQGRTIRIAGSLTYVPYVVTNYVQAFDEQTQRGHVIRLQWIDIRSMNSTQYEEVILNAVNVVTEGFITVLTNTTAFLHARYSATRNARLRLKDKYYLFLCEHEDPVEFLRNELLQILFCGLTACPGRHLLSRYWSSKLIVSVCLIQAKYDAIELFNAFSQLISSALLEVFDMSNKHGENGWGDVYDNGTGVGMFGGLFAQHIECAIGSMYDWYHDLYEVSHEIAETKIKFVTPGPAQYPRWRIIIMPFSLKAWIFIKYLGYCLRPTRSLQKEKYKFVKHFLKTLLDVFAVFIQQPSADTSLHRIASRVCLATLLFATLTLENTYSGQLKSFLTAPLFTDPVDTMDKWTKTNWKWTAPSMEWIINVEDSDLVKDQILAQKFEVNDPDFLYNISFRDDYGLGIEGLFSGSFTFGKYITAPALEGKIVTKDALYTAWTVAAGIRGWPLMPLLNRHISHCFETGLYTHWEKEAAAHILDRHTYEILAKLASGYKPNFPPQKLTVESISGALFTCFFIGNSLLDVEK
uniref:Ionotropic glutamate receptor C-terminal domain-containing protein n=1 Tax=Glossina palpalis gambiensis TaxID=67801 RepID=A0A1B0B8M5_9MUSC